MICYACKENRTEKALLYCVDDLKPYCAKPAFCNGTHPMTLGKQLVNEEGLLTVLRERFPKEMANALEKYANRPVTVRMKPSHLLFLFRYQFIRGTDSISETIVTALTELQLLLDDVMNADISRIHMNWSIKPLAKKSDGPPKGIKPEPEPEPEPLMPPPQAKKPEPEPEDNIPIFRFEV